MNFWDTVLGHRLAETLIRELPKLSDKGNDLEELLSEVKALRKEVEELKSKLIK